MASVSQEPDVLNTSLHRECKAGRILGPFASPSLPNFRTSGLGLVPKHDGGWRIIYHLSTLAQHSNKDYKDPESLSLTAQ